MATRTLDGLQISVNLTTLDDAANKFASLLPAKLTSQLPVAIPNAQVLTVDLATVTVSSAASPSFSGLTTASSTAPDTSPGDIGFTLGTGVGRHREQRLRSGPPSGPHVRLHRPAATSPTRSTPAPAGGHGRDVPSPPAPAVFKGVGSALMLLGVLAAALMAYAYKRADDASELVGAACADGDPLGIPILTTVTMPMSQEASPDEAVG